MANLEYDPGILGQEFNKLYAEITNCEVIPPPQYTGRVPQQFFLKKRGGFVDLEENFQLTEIFDEEYFDSTHWVIGTDSHLTIKKTGSTMYEIDNGVMPTGRNHKFFTLTHVVGNKLNVTSFTGGEMKIGTALEPDPVPEGTLYYEFPAATFTGGEYNQKYLFIKSGTGEGQIIKIETNNTYRLFLDGSYATKALADSVIDIYPAVGDTLAFVGIDALYTIPNYLLNEQPVTIKLPRTDNAIDIAIKDSKLYWFDKNYNFYVSSRGSLLMAYFTLSSDLVGTVKNAYNITQYQDYVLILSGDQINIYKETQTQVGTNSYVTIYSIQNVSKTHGLFLPGSFYVYNQGLYVFTKEKRFVAMTITPSGTNRYAVGEQDQGIYMQKFFDLLDNTSGNKLSVFINSRNIYIIYSTSTDSEIFTYETQYLGWHRWKTSSVIREFKRNWFGADTYKIDSTATTDLGTDEIQQKIKYILGESNIHTIKRDVFQKLLLGETTSRTSYVNFIYNQGGTVETYTKTLEQVGYLLRPLLDTNGTQGTTLLGYNVSFMNSNPIVSYAGQTNIEIPTGFFYELCIIELIGEGTDIIEFGGFLAAHETLLPQVTERTNVI